MRFAAVIRTLAGCFIVWIFIYIFSYTSLLQGMAHVEKSAEDEERLQINYHIKEDDPRRVYPAPTMITDIKDEQNRRLGRINDMCSRYDIHGSIDKLFAYAPRNVSYCSNHKSASTYWLQVFRFLHKDTPPGVTKPSDVPKFFAHLTPFTKTRNREFSIKLDREETMHNFRFLVARDPYQRLWSVYIDKFVLLDLFFWRTFAPEIRDTFLRDFKDASDTWLKLDLASSLDKSVRQNRKGHHCRQVSFEEFLFYVVSKGTSDVFDLDDHLKPVHVGCNPCSYKPDFVGKVESLTREKGFLLEMLGLEPDIDGVTSYEDHVRYEIQTITDFEYKLLHMASDPCVTSKNLQERLITAFILNGYLPRDALETLRPSLPLEQNSFTNRIMDMFTGLQRSHDDVKREREQRRKEAFRLVPYHTLLKLQQIFKYDFLLFDYDPRPGYIFDDRLDFEIGAMVENK